MNGLLFTGGAQPNMQLAKRLFGQYSYVVAADSGLLGARSAGLIPDAIVGDMDSLPDKSILDSYSSKIIYESPRDKDLSDTELGLDELFQKGIRSVVLIGGGGGRMDHFFAIRSLFDGDKYPTMWIGEDSVLLVVEAESSNATVTVSGLDSDSPVSVFAAGQEFHKCQGRGFHWQIDALEWNKGNFSLSNRCPDGHLDIVALSGRFLVIVPLLPTLSIQRVNGDF